MEKTFIMSCPKHVKKRMQTSKHVKIKVNGIMATTPMFYCDKCGEYYIHPAKVSEETHAVCSFEGKAVNLTKNLMSVVLPNNGEVKKNRKKESASSEKKANKKDIVQKINEKRVTEKKVTNQKATESKNEIRMHIFDNDVDPKLVESLKKINQIYPTIMPEGMEINTLIKKVFPSKIAQTCSIRNMSFKSSRDIPVRRVEIYSRNSSYLKTRLPKDAYLVFSGQLKAGELVVDDAKIVENPIRKADDQIKIVTYVYGSPSGANCLYDFTETPAENPEKLTEEITSWSNYLDWRRRLAEIRIRGLKYLGYKVDIENRQMILLVVSEGKEKFDDFKRYLLRNEISVFSNRYSTNRWFFEFNSESQDYQNSDIGIPMTFISVLNHYGINDIEDYEWDELREYSRKYDHEEDTEVDTRYLVGGVNRNYFEPIFYELSFTLSNNATETLDRQLRLNGVLADNILEIIAKEFYSDGYIATSQIGDFALIRRLKGAIEDFINGKSVSEGLEQWLFDITKAREPEQLIDNGVWLNPSLNNSQRVAVKKMVAVPDVCLIQGPPGTGKTTVIAEAVYQFVIRNKRVLIASQANLAVDNALDRLIINPKIRAIRLGNAKKIDSSVNNITEENVLESFYNSVVEYVSSEYLNRWKEIDKKLGEIKRDIQSYYDAREKIMQIENQIELKKSELYQLNITNDNMSTYSKLNEERIEKINLMMLRAYCQGTTDDLEMMLNGETLTNIWNGIYPYIKDAHEKGLKLTSIGIDTNNIEDAIKLSRANEIVKLIIINAKQAIALKRRLVGDSEFGSNSREFEELKVKEKLLMQKMLQTNSPDDFSAWSEVRRQLNECPCGVNLTDEEFELFVSNGMEQEEIVNVLDRTDECIEMLLNTISNYATIRINEISKHIGESTCESNKYEKKKVQLIESIQSLEKQRDSFVKIIQNILIECGATEENFVEKCEDKKEELLASADSKVDRDTWEGIFTGLANWVENIPDYTQEKDVYLRDYINGCNVVGVSCTENARTLLENGFDSFDVVIIDEVSKATPPELLIPMLRGKKIILVGDHRQLPPLFNEHEKTYQEVVEQQDNEDETSAELTMENFHKFKDMVTSSLFQRYFENAPASIKETLVEQYRMHKDIMEIVNLFYDGRLKDGNEGKYDDGTKSHGLTIESTSGTSMIVPEHHAYWFDSSEIYGVKVYEQRREGSSSAENILEAYTIVKMLRKMELQYANRIGDKRISIGVISFYYDQVALIRKLLREESFQAINVDINTVDRFQGKEKEIVFVSLVRNTRRSAHRVDSHIAAFQRINVAFSRAQSLLVIVGAKDMYADQPVVISNMDNGKSQETKVYKQIMEMLNQKGTYFSCDEIISEIEAEDILQQIN